MTSLPIPHFCRARPGQKCLAVCGDFVTKLHLAAGGVGKPQRSPSPTTSCLRTVVRNAISGNNISCLKYQNMHFIKQNSVLMVNLHPDLGSG